MATAKNQFQVHRVQGSRGRFRHGRARPYRMQSLGSLVPLLLFIAYFYSQESTLFARASAAHDYEELDPDVVQAALAGNATDAALYVMGVATEGLQARLARLFENAPSPACRELIGAHFQDFVHALADEEALPFGDYHLHNACPEPVYDWNNLPKDMHVGMIQNRTYHPEEGEEGIVYKQPHELQLLYAILAHDDASATIRLMEALREKDLDDVNRTTFVIHVDGKAASDATYQALVDYAAASQGTVHVVPERVRINWGGFSMVNATLQILQYAFGLMHERHPHVAPKEPLRFDKFVHLSQSSYPLASNGEIRERLASFPLDANFLNVIMKPTQPHPTTWYYFVECDDRLHRIHQLPPLSNATHGAELYTASQWFIIARDFAEYLAKAEPGTFVHHYLAYVQHVVVADEHFFGTILRNTMYCTKHHNRNFVHLQFDRWESDIPAAERDPRKCLFPDPDRCGRSPTTLTTDYADIMELSDDLFARKFDDRADANVKDVVDAWRARREAAYQARQRGDPNVTSPTAGLPFEGHGVLIVAKDTVNDWPLCLGLGDAGNELELTDCFHDWVPDTLAPDWQTGAVVLQETLPHNRWEIGPCTSDGTLERLPAAELNVTAGIYSTSGPRCMLKQMDGIRAGRCFDGDSGYDQPGGPTFVFPCTPRHTQFLSFGGHRGDLLTPKNSMFFSIPAHVQAQYARLGHADWLPHMCLGVYERGDADEEDWDDDDASKKTTAEETMVPRPSPHQSDGHWEPLSEFREAAIITTQCSNVGAVIEWIFVPYIIEDEDEIDQRTDAQGFADSVKVQDSTLAPDVALTGIMEVEKAGNDQVCHAPEQDRRHTVTAAGETPV